ncbi:hypothetical protein M427DRAFT_34735 [Gonapodya prolifera JEL478]|uniref:Uncharacterized protein n=1 Tax=Gonapodya prolifera (strain JEL478) TaxID=1344416 RepID=A0A139A7Y7_GONPJ|nr:hypothetical protein M427DRAFT_34735 [Gonapodya prolifera JEL478]|eukprot:KXS12555.1 hypothetical protein M427DRAFT_34735 [Gonapodya prolifera JEL478]
MLRSRSSPLPTSHFGTPDTVRGRMESRLRWADLRLWNELSPSSGTRQYPQNTREAGAAPAYAALCLPSSRRGVKVLASASPTVLANKRREVLRLTRNTPALVMGRSRFSGGSPAVGRGPGREVLHAFRTIPSSPTLGMIYVSLNNHPTRVRASVVPCATTTFPRCHTPPPAHPNKPRSQPTLKFLSSPHSGPEDGTFVIDIGLFLQRHMSLLLQKPIALDIIDPPKPLHVAIVVAALVHRVDQQPLNVT